MMTALILSIHTHDVAGAIFSVVWLLLMVIVSLADYGFKHGWFVPTDEEIRKYSESRKGCP